MQTLMATELEDGHGNSSIIKSAFEDLFSGLDAQSKSQGNREVKLFERKPETIKKITFLEAQKYNYS